MAKKQKNVRNILLTILILILIPTALHYYGKYFRANLEKYPKLYCYEFRSNELILDCFYIDDLDSKKEYLNYYKENDLSERDGNLKFTYNYIQKNIPLYILEYTSDSLLAKFYGYDSFDGKNRGTIIEGWVYVGNLHEQKYIKK